VAGPRRHDTGLPEPRSRFNCEGEGTGIDPRTQAGPLGAGPVVPPRDLSGHIFGTVPLFAPVFDALNRSGTRYVIVGGVATILHGYVRGTTDVDVVIDLDETSARRAIQELEGIGYRPQAPVQASDFADRPTRETWARDRGMIVFSLYSEANPVVVDLFVRSPMDFEGLWMRSEVRALEGGSVRVASLDDLINIKRNAARPQDLVDVTELEAIRREAHPGNRPT
jgi:hypothetical protein